MPSLTRRQIQRAILKEMILRECACQDQEEERMSHGTKFHNNGPEEESGMIRSNLYTLSQQAREMHDMIGMNDDLDEWVQEKIAVASSMIDSVYDYIGYEYKSMRGDVSSHDSYKQDMLIDDQMHGDRVASFETGYDFAASDMEDDESFDDEEYDEYFINEEDERELDDIDAEEVMRRPWKPMHQSTGIMMFEDELDYEPTA